MKRTCPEVEMQALLKSFEARRLRPGDRAIDEWELLSCVFALFWPELAGGGCFEAAGRSY